MSVGTHLRIEYLDQNESFAGSLPRSGVVSRKLRTADSTLGTCWIWMIRLNTREANTKRSRFVRDGKVTK